MRKLLLLLPILALTGCASLNYAGVAEYDLTPTFSQKSHTFEGYALRVRNGKEIASVKATMVKKGNNFTLTLKELGVKAFQGQAIAAGAANSLASNAVKAALIGGGVLIAPVAGAAIASGPVGALVGGAAAGGIATKALSGGTGGAGSTGAVSSAANAPGVAAKP